LPSTLGTSYDALTLSSSISLQTSCSHVMTDQVLTKEKYVNFLTPLQFNSRTFLTDCNDFGKRATTFKGVQHSCDPFVTTSPFHHSPHGWRKA